MKYFILLISILFIRVNANSQNLVLNPSFENYLKCKFNVGAINDGICFYWDSPKFGTPDYYNKCNDTIPIYNAFSVPNNCIGYQLAFDGVAYAGIINGGGGG